MTPDVLTNRRLVSSVPPLFDVHFEWGVAGARSLARTCDVVVVVDVLSFSTSVTVAVHQGAVVYPYQLAKGVSAVEYARQLGAKRDASGTRPPSRGRAGGAAAGWR
jgi:hypothetical protein